MTSPCRSVWKSPLSSLFAFIASRSLFQFSCFKTAFSLVLMFHVMAAPVSNPDGHQVATSELWWRLQIYALNLQLQTQPQVERKHVLLDLSLRSVQLWIACEKQVKHSCVLCHFLSSCAIFMHNSSKSPGGFEFSFKNADSVIPKWIIYYGIIQKIFKTKEDKLDWVMRSLSA